MAAPQIPNLLESLRKAKAAGSNGGLRGGPRSPAGAGSSSDAIIQQTDDDAAGSRLSAVDVGYLSDPYARAMAFSKQAVRRMPIINRGTFVRTIAIDALVQDFLTSNEGNVQIISLGAGTDTRPFRLLEGIPELAGRLLYHEVDFAECTRKKITAISNAKLLSAFNFQTSEDGTRLTCPSYMLHPLDLRKLTDSSNGLDDIDPSHPTLLISECCLTYLNSSTATQILQQFLGKLLSPDTPVSIILYEPLHPTDAFGTTMTSNLSARGISLPGLQACPTLEAHQERLKHVGFDKAGGMLVKDWWKKRASSDEKDRLRNLEGLDEEEEWELLAGHYGFIWGSRGAPLWPKT